MRSEQAAIGFMGVGAIGQPMADRMLAHSPIVVCDVDEQARRHFAGRAETVESPGLLGNRVDIVFACLPTLQSYRDAVLSPDALLSGGRIRTFVHVGTTGPELAQEMNAACVERGIAMIDAPVTGGPTRARAGKLGVMAAGSRSDFAKVEPLIGTYASAITYLGAEPGQAQIMKLINNMLSAANLAVASEVLVLGIKAGLDPTQMLEVLNAGTGQNSAKLTKIPDHILPRTFDYGGRLEVAHKDLVSMVRQADQWGISAPLSRLIEATYRQAIAEEGADADMTTVIRHMERSAQVEVCGERG
jgi:2-hydroxy-3-oxopropionate reductase